MIGPISPQAIRGDLIARREIALVDLREGAAFASGHPLFAAQISLDRLETEMLNLVPRRGSRIVLFDNGEELVSRAAATLETLGYTNLHQLEGGLHGWRAAGYELF